MFNKLLLTITLFFTLISCGKAKSVLFIGNSYTGGCRKALTEVFKNNSPEWKLQFHTKGGATLASHLKNPETKKLITTNKYDFVVLQEQSQRPALGGEYTKSFEDSVKSFCKIITKSGATPCLFLTWGRRDGDKRNSHIFPNFKTMQNLLTRAYEKVAKRHNRLHKVKIIPVGYAFYEINKGNRNKNLFKSLYHEDGTHPGKNGAFLASCIFWESLTKNSTTTIIEPTGIEEKTSKQLKEFAKNAVKKNKFK